MKTELNRPDAIKSMGVAAIAAGIGLTNSLQTSEENSEHPNGLSPLKITKVKAIATCPEGFEFVVVKV